MIDIGVNLTSRKFHNDREQVIERAHAAGVEQLVVTGTDLRSSREALVLAKAHGLLSTAGVHPHEAKSWDRTSKDVVRELCSAEEVVAVGECGLDFDRNFSPPQQQRDAFAAQIEIAIELEMPLFVHERSAHDALLEILSARRSALGPVVVHCFTGTREELQRYLDLDLHLGITGWICDERRGTHLLEIVSEIPANRLMIETDAPWLLPRSLRPRPKKGRNEPAYLGEIRDCIARACKKRPADVARESSACARAFFGLGHPQPSE